MWTKEYTTHTELPAAVLWKALADVERWPEWDRALEYTKLTAPAGAGVDFWLKPKGGPRTRVTILEYEPPTRHVDVSHLPLARMKMEHHFTESGGRTEIRISLSLSGPLGFLWRRLVGEKLAAGIETQVRDFIDYARKEKTGGG